MTKQQELDRIKQQLADGFRDGGGIIDVRYSGERRTVAEIRAEYEAEEAARPKANPEWISVQIAAWLNAEPRTVDEIQEMVITRNHGSVNRPRAYAPRPPRDHDVPIRLINPNSLKWNTAHGWGSQIGDRATFDGDDRLTGRAGGCVLELTAEEDGWVGSPPPPEKKEVAAVRKMVEQPTAAELASALHVHKVHPYAGLDPQ